jgi:hypothetical protein
MKMKIKDPSAEKKLFKAARLGYILLLLPIILFVWTGCTSNQAAVKAELGAKVTIGVGQGASITGQDLLVTFNEMIGDSRCPEGATCIWAGVASARVTILHQGKSYAMALNQPGLTEQATAAFADYTLTFSLAPYPKVGGEIALKDYKLTLTLTR